MTISTRTEAHEFVPSIRNSDRCCDGSGSAEGSRGCGQPREAPIHRAAETPAERCYHSISATGPAQCKRIAELEAEIKRLQAELDSYKPHCSRGAVIGEGIGVKP